MSSVRTNEKPAKKPAVGKVTVPGHRILIVDDDPGLLRLLSLRLSSTGYSVVAAGSAAEALSHLAAERFRLLITDLCMDRMDGIELLEQVKRDFPAMPVIIITAQGTIPVAVEATRQGAFAFVTKPFNHHDFLEQIARAVKLGGAWAGTEQSPETGGAWRERFITRSGVMEEVMGQVAMVARSSATVLIQGESGTGKELIAQTVHQLSGRAEKPFVAINCGAIPKDLLESELFGHRRGAFTGAHRDHKGLFQEADGGTLLLDEIGDMPAALQIKLLRVIQEGEVRPVGAVRSIPVDVRIVSATHQDLEAAIREGRFRADLYYRLNVVAVAIPPLRERREDVPLLAEHFLTQVAERTDSTKKVFAPAALEHLVNQPWPGNVRQLYNVVEQTAVLSTAKVIPLSLI